MSWVVVGTRTCGTTRNALALLDTLGVSATFRETTRDPLTVDELRDVLRSTGLGAAQLLRVAEARKAGIDAAAGEATLLAAMAGAPRLVARPLVTDGVRWVLARPAEALRGLLP